jgi:hypothetical protein
MPFVIDSGAAEVAIPLDVFMTLRRAGTVSQIDFVGTGSYILADGSRQSSERFLLHKVSVGSHTVTNVVANVAPVKGQPLLGQSFLTRLTAGWSMDNTRHALVLHDEVASLPAAPITSQPGPSALGTFGSFAYDGYAAKFGLSWNQETMRSADEAAIKGCASDHCTIVFRTATNECGAIAMSDNGKVWGGAKRDQRAAAELAAIENCQKRTSGQCKVKGSECNR